MNCATGEVMKIAKQLCKQTKHKIFLFELHLNISKINLGDSFAHATKHVEILSVPSIRMAKCGSRFFAHLAPGTLILPSISAGVLLGGNYTELIHYNAGE